MSSDLKVKIPCQLGFSGEKPGLKNPTLKEIFNEIDLAESCVIRRSSIVIKKQEARKFSVHSTHPSPVREPFKYFLPPRADVLIRKRYWQGEKKINFAIETIFKAQDPTAHCGHIAPLPRD